MKRAIQTIAFVLILGVAGVAYWIYRDLHTPVRHAKSSRFIEIPRGSSPATVLDKLADEGIIKRAWPVAVYVRITGMGSRFKAGDYEFPSPVTPLAVLRRLEQGEQRLLRLTVIEGWTHWDIANAMARIPELGLADAGSVLDLMNDVSDVRDLDPKATDLEGYLYPDTYEFPPGTAPSQLIEIMVRRFREQWKPEWQTRAQAMNMTPREIVTAASLIETEAKLANERPLVASVIYNRLQREMPLAIDSTVIYASKLAGKWKNDGKVYKSDIERQSPYNTRLHAGLPPGPISSPGARSLEAALNPAQTDYLYYVREPSRDDGAHNFYENARDFEVGVRALRDWEHQRDLENAKQKNQPTP